MANKRYIVPADLAIEAFRSNGFKSTASALSELIDNSIEAGANKVDVILLETETHVGTREVWRLSEVAVLDNGSGMDRETIGTALQFGVGSRLDSTSDTGLGRFGMGLPNSAISQCKHVEVYSWTKKSKIYFNELDVDKIKRNKLQEFDEVTEKKIPEKQYLKPAHLDTPESGTLVIWKKCDRLDAAKGETLVSRIEADIGRTYRYFLAKKHHPVVIRIIVVRDGQAEPRKIHVVRANDPLYLLTPNTVPGHDTVATNVPFGSEDVMELVGRNGKKSKVTIKYTIAKPETQNETGNSDLGRHYEKNTGVSFVRAGREIDFLGFAIEDSSEPRHRWWSAEVSFPPNLDHAFGVPNSKQGVLAVEYFSPADLKAIKQEVTADGEDWDAHLETDASLKLNKFLSESINRNIKSMMDVIKGRREGTRSRGNTAEASPVEEVVRDELKSNPKPGLSNKEVEGLKENQIREQLMEGLRKVDPENAEKIAEQIEAEHLPIKIIYKSWPAAQFMSISRAGGTVILELNSGHNFIDALQKAKEAGSFEEINQILELMLCAYAKAEDEALLELGKADEFQDMREAWGKRLKAFIKDWNTRN